LFGPIEGFIRRFDYRFRGGPERTPPRHADTNGYPDPLLPASGPCISWRLVGRAIFSPDGKLRLFYGSAKLLQEGNHPLCSVPGHDERELLPPITEGLTEGYSLKTGSDEPQDLVPDLMPVTIVETLEVIHVHHRDGIVSPQPAEAFFETPTAGYARQLIQIGLSPGQTVKAA
jgi:hypothetical protein